MWGKWVPALVRTDWFHYTLLRQPKHLCVEAGHAAVNTWELPLAQPGLAQNHAASFSSSPRRENSSPAAYWQWSSICSKPDPCPDLVREKWDTWQRSELCHALASSVPGIGGWLPGASPLALLPFPEQPAVLPVQPIELHLNFIDCKTITE